MNFKKVFFSFLFSIVFPVLVFSGPVKISAPASSELTDKKIDQYDNRIISKLSTFTYASPLSKQQIADFYRNSFNSQGFKEHSLDKEEFKQKNVFIFERDLDKKTVRVIFLPFTKGSLNKYQLVLTELNLDKIKMITKCQNGSCGGKDAYGIAKVEKYSKFWTKGQDSSYSLPRVQISDPIKVDFIPTYPNVKQLEYIDWEKAQPPMISIGYISRQDSSEAINFCLKEMPAYGWDLSGQQPRKGTYRFSEWLPMLAPYTSFSADSEKMLPGEIPPLKIRGSTLTFTKGGQKCIITVYTFDDVIEVARQQKVYDITFMKNYGTTIIGIAYFY